MRFDVISLFPDLFDSFLEAGLFGKALLSRRISVYRFNPRDYTDDRHRSVDDEPYGGGSGMVMMPGPIAGALDAARGSGGEPTALRVLLTPQGEPFGQGHAVRYAQRGALALVCGRYEGVDERVRSLVDEEVSMGDFVLFGGEVAAMAVMEATARLVPGVLGNEGSLDEESHASGLLEYPHYTRPADFRGMAVPEVLRSGNHAAIARWRRKEALRRTRVRRPDLLDGAPLTDEDRALLAEIAREETGEA
jgi:tRNA (guanine37-N1)-methyltransferase